MESSPNLLNYLIMKGLTIKEILRKNGFTLLAVAEKIGESSQNLSSLLGKDDVRSSLIERISEATGIPIAAFYGDAYTTSATASGNGSTAIAGVGNSSSAISERFMTLLENKDKQIAKKDEQMDRLIGLLEKNAGKPDSNPQ